MTEPVGGYDGVIEIYPAATREQLNRLDATGKDLGAAWKSALGTLNSARRLGGGPMGRAFKPTIDAANAAKEETKKGPVGSVADFYQKAKQTGDAAVDHYEAGETAATSALTPDSPR